jgi:hypothetical protein
MYSYYNKQVANVYYMEHKQVMFLFKKMNPNKHWADYFDHQDLRGCQ